MFTNNAILSFFSLFLIIDLYFLIIAVVYNLQFTAHIFNATAELARPIGITTNEAKSGIEPHPAIETKLSDGSL